MSIKRPYGDLFAPTSEADYDAIGVYIARRGKSKNRQNDTPGYQRRQEKVRCFSCKFSRHLPKLFIRCDRKLPNRSRRSLHATWQGQNHKRNVAHIDTTTLEEHEMKTLRGFFARLRKDENGASLIEYSILIGLISALAVGSILLMGEWVASQWALLVSVTSAG